MNLVFGDTNKWVTVFGDKKVIITLISDVNEWYWNRFGDVNKKV